MPAIGQSLSFADMLDNGNIVPITNILEGTLIVMHSRFSLLIGLLISLIMTGCLPALPKNYPSKGAIPAFNGTGCTVTIVSSNQFDAFTAVDIAVGDNVVTKLGKNEYTKFQLPVSTYWLRLVWGEWGFFGPGYFGNVDFKLPNVHSKGEILYCKDSGNFLYGVYYNSSASNYAERFDLKPLAKFNEGFSLEGKSFIPVRVER